MPLFLALAADVAMVIVLATRVRIGTPPTTVVPRRPPCERELEDAKEDVDRIEKGVEALDMEIRLAVTAAVNGRDDADRNAAYQRLTRLRDVERQRRDLVARRKVTDRVMRCLAEHRGD